MGLMRNGKGLVRLGRATMRLTLYKPCPLLSFNFALSFPYPLNLKNKRGGKKIEERLI